MSGISTILLAASTSAGVALVIEWIAKPGLEARKERILERHRAQREIARQLKAITMNMGSLAAEIPAHDAPGKLIVMRFKQERREAIIESGQKINEAIIDAGSDLNNDVRALVSNVAGMAQSLNPTDTEYKPAEHIQFVAGFCLDLYLTPRWRMRRRREFRRHARNLAKAISEDSRSSAEPSDP